MKAVFFCGQQSRYGQAHLRPILDSFEVEAVVFADQARWDLFSEKLSGKAYHTPKPTDILSRMARLLPGRVRRALKGDFRAISRIRREVQSRGVKLLEVFDVNSARVFGMLKQLNADLFLSAAYPQIFSKQMLEIPRKGAVNFHPSLLPKYRGAHPHFWQIVQGEHTGGITAHFMTERIDDGDIVAQTSFSIEDKTYSELYDLIVQNIPQQVRNVGSFFERGNLVASPQNPADATYFKNNREIHSRIFWNIHSSREIMNLIRTETAYCFFRGIKVGLVMAKLSLSNRNLTNGVRVENGAIVEVGQDGIAVMAKDGCIGVSVLKIGRRIYPHLEFAKRMNLCVGELLG